MKSYPIETVKKSKTIEGIASQLEQKATKARLSDVSVNVKDYGAVGNGVTDDTIAIQNAINAASLGSRRVFFPRGIYLTGTLSYLGNENTLYGTGSGFSIIQHKDGIADSLIKVMGYVTGTPTPAYPHGGFEGLRFRGGNQTTNLIYLEGQIDNLLRFDDLRFSGHALNEICNGVSTRDYLNWSLDKIRFDYLGGYGIQVRDASAFSHSYFSLNRFTYDNENANFPNGFGKGLFFIDMTNLSVEKGVAKFSQARIELNNPLSPTNTGLIRVIQNVTRVESSPSQISLTLQEIAGESSRAVNDKIITVNVRDISLRVLNSTWYGARIIYNNDTTSSKSPIYGHSANVVRMMDFSSNYNRFDVPYAYNQNRKLGINETVFSGDSALTEGMYDRGDVTYNLRPRNITGSVGRAFAYKNVDDADGRMIGGNTVVLGSVTGTLGSNQITVASVNSLLIPGTLVDIAGANQGVKILSFNGTTATLSANLTANVASAQMTIKKATMMAVDMVFYNTSMPTSGTYQIGDYVKNTNTTILGTAGSKYVVKGWIRTTAGINHVLNTDWVEDKVLTGS